MGGLSHTVSGDIASFRTPSRVPIESLKFHFLPKQAAGTPSPENPIPIEGWTGLDGYGTGENLLPFDFVMSDGYTRTLDGLTATYNNGVVRITGNHTKSGWTNIIDFYSVWQNKNVTLPPGTYNMANGLCVVCKIDGASYVNKSGEFTVNESAIIQGFYVPVYGEGEKDITVPLVLSLGTTRPKKYEPYYPIKTIPITFPTGKNLLNTMDVTNPLWYNTFSPGRIDAATVGTGNSNYVKFNQVFHAGTYTISGKISGPGVKAIRLLCSSQIAGSIWNSYYDAYFIDTLIGGKWTFTLNEDSMIGIVFVIADGHGTEPGSIYDLQLEYGSEATDFEPWSPISAFYGGYIDPVAGEIVVEYALYETTWGSNSAGTVLGDTKRKGFYVGSIEFANAIDLHNNGQGPYGKYRRTLCNIVPWGWDYFSDYPHYYINNHDINLMMPVDTPDDTAIQFCALLKTPIHIPFPAEDMKAFLDHNNFWSDANDITEVTYAVTESKDMLATRKLAMDFDHTHHKKVKWNNMAGAMNDQYWVRYNPNMIDVDFENNEALITVKDTSSMPFSMSIRTNGDPVVYSDHRYYVSYCLYPYFDNAYFGAEFGNNVYTGYFYFEKDKWSRFSYRSKAGGDGMGRMYIPYFKPGSYAIGDSVRIKNAYYIDLTLMFGAGNEPTESEFEHICELNGIDLTTYQPYDEGSDRWLIIP